VFNDSKRRASAIPTSGRLLAFDLAAIFLVFGTVRIFRLKEVEWKRIGVVVLHASLFAALLLPPHIRAP
jgi:hypothetical protein